MIKNVNKKSVGLLFPVSVTIKGIIESPPKVILSGVEHLKFSQ